MGHLVLDVFAVDSVGRALVADIADVDDNLPADCILHHILVSDVAHMDSAVQKVSSPPHSSIVNTAAKSTVRGTKHNWFYPRKRVCEEDGAGESAACK